MSVSGEPSKDRSNLGPLIAFFGWLTALAALRIGLAYVQVPIAWNRIAELPVAILFVVVPVYAVFRAASYCWTMRLGIGFVIGGLCVHGAIVWAVSRTQAPIVPVSDGRAALFACLGAVQETALFTWCIGLGTLIARLFREKNVLLPVCLFLALFDVFLVLTPFGFTHQIMAKAPAMLPAMGHTIPRVQSHATHGVIVATGYIGPADFIFMAMFFVSLFKFEMRTALTLRVLIPTLLAYMLLARVMGSVPMLVPIGFCVLLVNAREFKLNREETLSTALVAALGVGLIALGAFMKLTAAPEPAPQVAPSPSADGRA